MPVGVWGVLHGLCLKKGHNLPANLGLGVEFPSHGGQNHSGDLAYAAWVSALKTINKKYILYMDFDHTIYPPLFVQ